ncbi:MAG: recombinase [Thermoplasmatales archaeon]|nr:recombinase [Thermoplasmatales archaeon]
MDGRRGIIDIDDDERVVYFDPYYTKKITGTRVGAILGVSGFSTPFKCACEMAGIYPGDRMNKYMEAGNILEPVIREYVASNVGAAEKALGMGPLSIEEPVPADRCGYDHFHDDSLFGGLVDGYLVKDGRRVAVFEIKTSADRESWLDGNGDVSVIPESYMLQASLYAHLSGLDKILFAVGFLEDADYDRPRQWIPTPDNVALIAIDRLDMEEQMAYCKEWYDDYIKTGCTPEWTDRDADVVKYLKAYKPGGKRKGGRR